MVNLICFHTPNHISGMQILGGEAPGGEVEHFGGKLPLHALPPLDETLVCMYVLYVRMYSGTSLSRPSIRTKDTFQVAK